MINDKYKAILKTHLLPIMRKVFPDGNGFSIQQSYAYYRPKKSSDVGLTNEDNNVARFLLPIVH